MPSRRGGACNKPARISRRRSQRGHSCAAARKPVAHTSRGLAQRAEPCRSGVSSASQITRDDHAARRQRASAEQWICGLAQAQLPHRFKLLRPVPARPPDNPFPRRVDAAEQGPARARRIAEQPRHVLGHHPIDHDREPAGNSTPRRVSPATVAHCATLSDYPIRTILRHDRYLSISRSSSRSRSCCCSRARLLMMSCSRWRRRNSGSCSGESSQLRSPIGRAKPELFEKAKPLDLLFARAPAHPP